MTSFPNPLNALVGVDADGNAKFVRTNEDGELVAEAPAIDEVTVAVETSADEVVAAVDTSGDEVVAALADVTTAVNAVDATLTEAQGTPGAAAPLKAFLSGWLDPGDKLRPPLVDQFGRPILSATDFFGRLSTAEPLVIANGYAAGASDTYKWSSLTANGGTVVHNPTTGEYDISTTGASGSTAIHIFNQTAIYRPGFPLDPMMSSNLSSTSSTNKRIEWGVTSGIASSDVSLQTSDALGYYLENNVFGMFYRSSLSGAYPGNTVNVPQASWNVDKLDGSGRSGKTFTLSSLLSIGLFEPVFVWLGAWGIQWILNKRPVHEVRFDEPGHTISAPFQRIPHVRMYVYARNSGASAASTLSYNCGSVLSLGGGDATETPFAGARLTALTIPSVSGAVPIYAVRPSATFGGVSNSRRLAISAYEIQVTGQDFFIQMYHGKASDFTFTGGAWAAPPNTPRSSFEQNITATAVTIGAGASVIHHGFIDSNSFRYFDVGHLFTETKLGVGIGGTGEADNLVIVATSQAGANGTARVRSIVGHEIG